MACQTNNGSLSLRFLEQLVGLPGTSKTLVAQKVCRYLQWLGIASRVFNVGNFRRKLFGAHQPHTFFDPANPEGERLRSQARDHALQEMMSWFRNEQGIVAIYDATNATRARREVLLQECRKNDVQVMFIESVCEDEGLRLLNAIEIQRSSPDYAQMDSEMALQDFKMRVGHYGGHYETMTEKDLTYIKLIDAGSQVILSQIQGYLQSRIVYYLMNLRIRSRNIYFSRHGESLFNVMGLLGGDSELSARGKQYARALPVVVSTYVPNSDRLTVWTSTKKRTIATAKHLPHKKLAWKALDELEAGKADGLTYEQVEEQFPEDFANRDNDKFNYRYQDGESYRDVVARLEPVLVDLERQDDILIIGHQAILRCLYAYFMNMSHERLPYIKIPLHTLIQLTPGAYRCEEKRFKVDIDAVDTHRPKPKTAVGGSQTPVNTHPAQDAPLINIAPVMLPNTPLTTADIAEAERNCSRDPQDHCVEFDDQHLQMCGLSDSRLGPYLYPASSNSCTSIIVSASGSTSTGTSIDISVSVSACTGASVCPSYKTGRTANIDRVAADGREG
ncbi:6-phosphofructo-2-kinase-domain-containing protein [Gamsiella multidivaricata]|uniref:6-phosphofructo-2-kinase-domain-containing protein n=1 Tax=Gamsiella multidivaricata TaxID=101098 RepID=UPI00221E778C|nr:6-phosphofructo-2-kinase-domain-containing protein [Gamsiella multidivaricata]KAI7821576.1 6-phosphofructo-2-kinase-domain-containing protein [Gamsiella multidivaricata]